MISFNEMNISDEIKKALGDMGFDTPTPVQEEVIPLILDGRDVIAQAPTGTGKTCAFGIPVINNIDSFSDTIQALILCPTRELVIQTENELKDVAKYKKEIKIVSIYGGQNYDRQLAGLRKKPQIIIGTTGRVMDHIRRRTLKLDSLKTLILDEMDEMLNMGFREDIDVILEVVPKVRQTVLFSATMPKEIVEISKSYQTSPLSVKTQHKQNDIPNINQYYVKATESEKVNALLSIMNEKKYGLALVFCNTKKRVDELHMHVNSLGINSDALHGDLRQRERDKTMKKFRTGETRMLIATDVAARGIDVDNIEAIFNFDIPHDEEYYVHRIGRTARANKLGDAYTFVSDKQMYVIRNFERYTKTPISEAEFSASPQTENSIDEKLLKRAVRILKRADLTEYKKLITAEFYAFKETHEDAEILDFAAALFKQLNDREQPRVVTLSEPPRVAMRDTGKTKDGGKRGASRGVKFFMNIGTRDKCDPKNIAKFITVNTSIPAESIFDINCLENYSFANVAEGHNDEMESLNGLKFSKRILAVEVAANSKNKSEKKISEPSDVIKPEKKPAGSYGAKPKQDGKLSRNFSKDKNEKKSKKFGK